MPHSIMEKHETTQFKIEQALLNWGAQKVEVKNNSHLHVGHEGAKSGGGHFAVFVVTDQFVGMNRIKRHRLVYQQLGDLFDGGEIHALEVDAKTTEEVL